MGDWKGRKKHNYTEHPQKIVPLPWEATGRTILTPVGITDPKKTTAGPASQSNASCPFPQTAVYSPKITYHFM